MFSTVLSHLDSSVFCRYVFPCRQWIPLSADKSDALHLECKSSEKSRMASIRGKGIVCEIVFSTCVCVDGLLAVDAR